MVSSISHTNTTNVDDATAKDTTSITKAILGTKLSSSLDDLKRWMGLIDDHYLDAQALTGIKTVNINPPPIPLTEEQELQQFIKDYIDEPPPKPQWKSYFDKLMNYTIAYGGRRHGKSIGYHRMIQNHVIIDDYCTPHEKTTLKPTKKQAKLLKKFRRLKRFK